MGELGGGLRAILLVLRFVLEMAAMVGLVLGLWQAVPGATGVVVAVVAGAVAIAAWGRFVAPRAPVKLPTAGRLAIELVVFLGATAALLAAGHGGWAIALLAVYAVDAVGLQLTGGLYAQPGPGPVDDRQV